jgi:hypothetical protein
LWNTVLAATAGSTQFTSVTNAMMTDGTEVVSIPWIGGADYTTPVYSPPAWADMTDTAMIYALRCPTDYVSGGTVVVMAYCANAGNCYRRVYIDAGATGEVFNTHSVVVAFGVAAMLAGKWTAIASVNISAWVAAGDNISITVERDATDAADTLGEMMAGYCYFTYTANHGG